MEQLSSYSQYLELIAAIIGTVKYRSFKELKLRYVLFFLWYVVLTEFFSGISYPLFNIPNYISYNIYYLMNFLFWLWWYRLLLNHPFRRQILMVFLVLYVLFFVIDAVWLQDFNRTFMSFSYALGSIFLTVAIGFYFVEMLNRDVVLHITRSPYFWVSFGLLVYCVTFLPYEIAIGFMQQQNLQVWSIVLFIINIIQYGCFAIAFVKSDRDYKEHPIS